MGADEHLCGMRTPPGQQKQFRGWIGRGAKNSPGNAPGGGGFGGDFAKNPASVAPGAYFSGRLMAIPRYFRAVPEILHGFRAENSRRAALSGGVVGKRSPHFGRDQTFLGWKACPFTPGLPLPDVRNLPRIGLGDRGSGGGRTGRGGVLSWGNGKWTDFSKLSLP